ncbi:MAG: M28 family peptidase [Fimbriimonadaceae bacterium]
MSGKRVFYSLAILACSLVLSCGFSQTAPQTTTAAPAQTVAAPQATTAPQWKFDGKVAWDSLVKQVAFGPRVPGTEPQLKCRDYLLAELKKGCDDAHIQHLTHHWSFNNKDVDIYNVIGTQNWKNAKVRVVLLAHWDSRPFSDGPMSPAKYRTEPFPYEPIPGANDGASGAAVLIELAQAIKGKHPDVGVCYLLDDGEDLGPGIDEMLLGVDYFAEHLPDPKPDYGILLDMIGKTDMVVGEEIESQKYADRVVKAFYANAQAVGLGKTFPAVDGDDVDDDHWPLIKRGIPTMDLIDFKYDQWHTVDDTPAHCSQKSLEATGIALESFLLKQPPFVP